MARWIPLLFLAVTLPGCLFSNRQTNTPIDPAAVAALEPNRTSAAEVAALMGAPMDVVQLGHRSAWRYDHVVEKQTALVLFVLNLRGVDTDADRVWVFFDEQGVLTHVGASLEAGLAEHDLPIF